MSNFTKHWANLRVGPIISKMMAKVYGIGRAFCDFARHAATMVVVISGLCYNLHGALDRSHRRTRRRMDGVKSSLSYCFWLLPNVMFMGEALIDGYVLGSFLYSKRCCWLALSLWCD